MLARRPPEQSGPQETPLEACEASILSLRAKADRNERLARVVTFVAIGGSALIPLCIIASTKSSEFALGKLVPALLATLSALAAAVLEFERPHDRWRMYRGYQRRFEDLRLRFHSRVAPFDTDEKAALQALAVAVGALRLAVHDEWSGLVPSSATVAGAVKPASAERPGEEASKAAYRPPPA